MDNLQSRNIKVYRTDESGTVISTSDGENITFNCKEGTYNYGDNNSTSISNNTTGIGLVKPKPTSKQNNDIVGKQSDKSHNNGSVVNNTIISKQGKVYYTAKGKCYHSIKSCPTLRRSKNIMTGTASNCGGRRPCSKCN
ncbi:metallo beta-lactamase family protein [Clostridium phage D-1873]|uniref:Metallo beta-lactamase family protein n=2 Tax=Clostridium botulinum TaxID=1491 RepID=A0A9P2LK98_CLOBO|nr:metallo beta-lactamase family protein [Clostridium phage D-1873]